MKSDLELAKSLLSPPGDTLQETLEERGMSQAELAERMGRPKEKLNDIIKGREPITTATAYQLEKVLGIPASFWINREQEYRQELYELEQQERLEACTDWLRQFPVNVMRKMSWLPDTSKGHELVEAMLKFFGVASHEEWNRIYVHKEVSVAFRVSLAHTKSPHAVSAWLRMGELQTKGLQVAAYDKKAFKQKLSDIKELAYTMPSDYADRLQAMCAECGVALVYTPTLPKAPISGATRWFHHKPLIQLSGRFKKDDHFWFTFFHEAGHILLHGKKDIFLENLEGTETDQEKEEEANEFSARTLLSKIELNEIIRAHRFDEVSIQKFAEKFRTPPGVIVGQLQRQGHIPYAACNDLKQPIDLFEKV
ncbi:MAG: ImmA/IrrE family metallo-endopeptidase [Cyclobacteriaceae bacterium]